MLKTIRLNHAAFCCLRSPSPDDYVGATPMLRFLTALPLALCVAAAPVRAQPYFQWGAAIDRAGGATAGIKVAPARAG